MLCMKRLLEECQISKQNGEVYGVVSVLFEDFVPHSDFPFLNQGY